MSNHDDIIRWKRSGKTLRRVPFSKKANFKHAYNAALANANNNGYDSDEQEVILPQYIQIQLKKDNKIKEGKIKQNAAENDSQDSASSE